MKNYSSDFEEVLDLRAYVRDDIQLNANYRWALRMHRKGSSGELGNFHARIVGNTAGLIFRNREVALEQYFPLSQGKFY